MSKSKVFVFICISFAVGILLNSYYNLSVNIVYVTLALSVLGFAFSFVYSNKFLIFTFVFLAALGLGALRMEYSKQLNEYQDLFETSQTLEGYITEEPKVKANNQQLTFKPDNFSESLILTTTLAQKFFYGDRVVVTGKIKDVKNFEDFDYKHYLERYNIYASVSYPKILILKSHQLNFFKENLLRLKESFQEKITSMFLEPQSSLAIGILIGGKASLPESVVENFNKTGTSHIIAVSGFNITIIVVSLSSLAYIVGRRASVWISLAIIICFVIITGASASVVRAGIMGSLLLFSFALGRQYSISPALFFAGAVMLVINPKILFWDIGFQLSFAATLGIVYFMPIFTALTENLPEALGAKTLVLTTFAAIISTLPIILFNFGNLSLSAPLVNVLVLPVVPFAMLFGFVSVLPFLGPGFALVSNWILWYMLKITEIFAHIPYSSVNIKISNVLLWILFITVFLFYFLLDYILKKMNIAKQQEGNYLDLN